MEEKPVVLISPQAASHHKAMATFLAQHGQYHLILLQRSIEDLAEEFDFDPEDDCFLGKMDQRMAIATNHKEDFKRYIKEVDYLCLTQEEIKQDECRITVDAYIEPWLNHITGGRVRKLVWWNFNGGFWKGWPA